MKQNEIIKNLIECLVDADYDVVENSLNSKH